jgi:hypothetical protein
VPDKTDWAAMRLAFITDPTKPDLRQFCGKHRLSYSTASKRAARENWQEDRQTHWQTVTGKAKEQVADLQATVVARDTAQTLAEIAEMKARAYEQARGERVTYEKPHEAVAAYERLVKLERLLTDQSTENLSVADGREAVKAILTVIREEVQDVSTLQRIAARLTSLDGPASRISQGDPQLN